MERRGRGRGGAAANGRLADRSPSADPRPRLPHAATGVACHVDAGQGLRFTTRRRAGPVVVGCGLRPVRRAHGRRLTPNPPMRSGLGVGTRGEGRGTRGSALDSDKWGRWRPFRRRGSTSSAHTPANGSGRVRHRLLPFFSDGSLPRCHVRAVRTLIPDAAAAACWLLPSISFCLSSTTC